MKRDVYTGPIGTKLGRNVHWIVLFKFVFFVERKYTKDFSKRVLSVINLLLWNDWSIWSKWV